MVAEIGNVLAQSVHVNEVLFLPLRELNDFILIGGAQPTPETPFWSILLVAAILIPLMVVAYHRFNK